MRSIVAVVTFAILFSISTACPKEGCLISIHNREYFINPQYQYNFFQAVAECTRRKMTLLTLDSAMKVDEVNTLLENTFEGKPMPFLYIGGFSWVDYNFYWISTGTPFNFTYWHPDEPNLIHHNCVHIGRYEKGLWNNLPCPARLGYICERSLIGSE